MKVAIVDPGAFTSRYDHEICRALAGIECDVELWSAPSLHGEPPAADGYRRRLAFARPLAGGAAPALRRWRPLRRLTRAAVLPGDLARAVARAREERFEILHWQWSLAPRLERLALARLARAGVATVVTVHNPRRRVGDRGATAASALLAARADAAIFLSGWAESEHRRRHAGPPLRAVVPHGVGDPPSLSRTEARARLALDPEAPLALMPGLLRPYKGVDVALDAFERVVATLPEARLAVVGLPVDLADATLRRLSAAERAGGVRTELRHVDDAELERWIVAADVVVLPYREGSQSGVGSLAISCERAVIASRVGGLGEMYGGADEGLAVPAGDAEALAAVLGVRLGDRPGTDALGRRLRLRRIRARGSWRAVAEDTLELYRRALRNRRS